MGPTRDNLIFDPKTVLHLDNRLYILAHSTNSAIWFEYSHHICLVETESIWPQGNWKKAEKFLFFYSLKIGSHSSWGGTDEKNKSWKLSFFTFRNFRKAIFPSAYIHWICLGLLFRLTSLNNLKTFFTLIKKPMKLVIFNLKKYQINFLVKTLKSKNWQINL